MTTALNSETTKIRRPKPQVMRKGLKTAAPPAALATLVQRATALPHTLSTREVTQLQGMVGNQTVNRLLTQTPGTVQRREGDRRAHYKENYVIEVSIGGSSYASWIAYVDQLATDWQRTDNVNDKTTPTGYAKKDPGENTQSLTYAGPGGANTKGRGSWGGVWDDGSNSIEKLVTNITKTLDEQIEKITKETEAPPVILIKGHSRGAVAASRVANGLAAKHKGVKVELTVFDPVPGPDHEGEDVELTLGSVEESTVVYSVASGRGAIFTPQKILGAKRVIITQQDHSGGIKKGFKYNKAIYDGSNLNALPSGIYVDFTANFEDEPKELQLVATIEEAKTNYKQALKNSPNWSDIGRKKIINAVIDEFFGRAKKPE